MQFFELGNTKVKDISDYIMLHMCKLYLCLSH